MSITTTWSAVSLPSATSWTDVTKPTDPCCMWKPDATIPRQWLIRDLRPFCIKDLNGLTIADLADSRTSWTAVV